MSEEKLRLPDFLLADLYKSSLVEIDSFIENRVAKKLPDVSPSTMEVVPDTTPLPSVAQKPAAINFLGDNAKRVSIVVEQADVAYLKEDDLAFLINILKACQLSLTDISIINTAEQEVTFPQLKKQLSPMYLMLFDVEPSAIRLPFLIPAFQLQKYDDTTIMMAPALSQLNQANQEGKLLKTKLWLSLKQMFGL